MAVLGWVAATELRGALPVAPSGLTATVTGVGRVRLDWVDNSGDELGFEVYYRIGGVGNFAPLAFLAANVTTVSLTGAPSGTGFQFVVVANYAEGTAQSAVLAVTTPGITSPGYEPAVVGAGFDYLVSAAIDGGAAEALSVAGRLPAGLVFDAGTGRITGVPGEAGVFAVTLTARYAAWGELSKGLTLRVIHGPGAPVVREVIPGQVLTVGGAPGTLELNRYFADRDTEQAVRVATTRGDFDVALYATATPLTVANFLGYVDRGDYGETLVHRAIAGFIVQGGGFRAAPPGLTAIATAPSPLNEPGVANVRGTIAMAKLAGNPNSATSQWFVSVADNRMNLDYQNGGFTAFGRVCGAGMGVVDALAGLPTGSYQVSLNGLEARLDGVPVDGAGAVPTALDFSRLVRVMSVRRIEPLSYRLTGNVGGAVAAVVQGTNLVLTATNLLGGTNQVTVVATDLDGNSVTQSFAVVVGSAYGDWAAAGRLAGRGAMPGVDGDGDGLANAVEFALMGSAGMADAAMVLPRGLPVVLAGERYGAVRFKLRKELAGLVVRLEAAGVVLGASWDVVWTSDDLAGAQVVERVDSGDHWAVTVRDAQALGGGGARRFLRLVVGTR